jgi:hypothetical protein
MFTVDRIIFTVNRIMFTVNRIMFTARHTVNIAWQMEHFNSVTAKFNFQKYSILTYL